MSQLEKIKTLLELRTELYKMVIADLLGRAGGEGLKLGRDFHKTAPSGLVRFTVNESARQKVLSRLPGLNHERWEEEQKAEGEAQKAVGGKPKKVKKSKSTDGQMGLL